MLTTRWKSECGVARDTNSGLKCIHKREYLRNTTVSEPADEWDDRNRIYCVKMNMVHSTHHAGSITRQT